MTKRFATRYFRPKKINSKKHLKVQTRELVEGALGITAAFGSLFISVLFITLLVF